MSDYQTPTTLLEAVNELLSKVGGSPLASLDDSGDTLPADADIARRALLTVSRSVQTRGWHFNTEYNYPLPPNADGEIVVPPNAMRVDTSGDSRGIDVVQRGQRLYDRANHTYIFSTTLRAEIVLLLPFDELPEYARQLITVRAGRQFQAGAVGSQTLNGFTEADETAAWALMQGAEADTADYNLFRDSAEMADLFRRG